MYQIYKDYKWRRSFILIRIDEFSDFPLACCALCSGLHERRRGPRGFDLGSTGTLRTGGSDPGGGEQHRFSSLRDGKVFRLTHIRDMFNPICVIYVYAIVKFQKEEIT